MSGPRKRKHVTKGFDAETLIAVSEARAERAYLLRRRAEETAVDRLRAGKEWWPFVPRECAPFDMERECRADGLLLVEQCLVRDEMAVAARASLVAEAKAAAAAESSRPSLFIAMPCYGGIEPGFVDSLLRLQVYLSRLGIAHEFRFLPGESLITRARNRMVRDFLDDTKHTHLLFLDVDLIFSPTTIVRLLTSGLDVVGGAYAKKKQGEGLVGNPYYANLREKDGQTVADTPPVVEGFARAREIGTGAMLVSRAAFVKLADKVEPYDCDLTGKKIRPYFDVGIETTDDGKRRYISEDYWFCRLWQDVAGGEVWMDTRAAITHVGKFGFTAPSLAEQWKGGPA